MSQEVLGGVEAGQPVVAGPAHADGLVVHLPAPLEGVLRVAAGVVQHLESAEVSGEVAIADPCRHLPHQDRHGDVLARAQGEAAGDPDLVAPGADLHLAVGLGIESLAAGHDGLGHLIAELVGVAREDHFTEAHHEGTLGSWV